MHLFHSLITSAFHYSSLAFLNVNKSIWTHLEKFYAKSLKMIFELPLNSNSQKIVEYFSPKPFRDVIFDMATRRFLAIIKSARLNENLVHEYQSYAGQRLNPGIIDRLFEYAGVDCRRDCLLCVCEIYHACVKRP